MSRAWVHGGLWVLATCCSACSIVGLEPPRSAPVGQPQPWRRACKRSIPLLMADMGIAALGALEATETTSLVDAGKVERVGGWITVGGFGLSAIYGTYVAISCASTESAAALRARDAAQPAPINRVDFPDTVLQFRFGTSVADCLVGAAGAGASLPGTLYDRSGE